MFFFGDRTQLFLENPFTLRVSASMHHNLAPIIEASAIVATANRASVLQRTLSSLAQQSCRPREVIVVDASDNDKTYKMCQSDAGRLNSDLRWLKAKTHGAASQRTEGVAASTSGVIWFFDDDVLFELDCVQRLWSALESDRQLGGVNAMIVNQRYQTPGAISRFMFTLMHGRAEESFAGKVIGPAVNLLPEDRDDLPEVVPVEWLNTTCTLYRREALPDPPFSSQFTGYSLMEDVALSLEVGKTWKLANARTARIFHDSQPADYKSDELSRSCMELVNRHFVMTRIMKRCGATDYLKLALWELFSLGSAVRDKRQRGTLLYILRGKWRGLREIKSRKS